MCAAICARPVLLRVYSRRCNCGLLCNFCIAPCVAELIRIVCLVGIDRPKCGKHTREMAKKKVIRGENTPEALREGAKILHAVAATMERGAGKIERKNQLLVKTVGTVGAWKAIAHLQRYANQLRADINNLPPGPPK
jgi:hypothetical protein